MKKMIKNKSGVTLVEMMITVALASIILLAMGAVLADSQKSFNAIYNRVNSPVVVDGYAARAAFDKTIRKASMGVVCAPVIGSSEVTVFYYSDPNTLAPDRFARFYVSGGTLFLEDGEKSTGNVLSTQRIADNVADVDFECKDNACVQMVLELDNDKENLIITSSAIRHNP